MSAQNPAPEAQSPSPQPGQLPAREATRRWPVESELHEREYAIGDRQLRAVVERSDGHVSVHVVTTLEPPLVLHWGVCSAGASGWQRPPDGWLPQGSSIVAGGAAQSPFREEAGLRVLDLALPDGEVADGTALGAVLHRPGTGQWLKDNGRDLRIALSAPRTVPGAGSNLAKALAATIVEHEVGSNSWTLMHRFELCHDLLEQAGADEDALVVLFVWLRYSALRQLDWQRRYNTQPRRLSHAQDRLTRRIAELWRTEPAARAWATRLMSTLGRGGEGQRVRDDILALMHRHHLKEVAGTFVEQWHQKLHNNTTPDDIAICDAFIAFLRSNGDVATFYRKLGEHGVTRERLASYDRPITVEPQMPHADPNALAADFEGYLALLRSVHDSADLASALGGLGDRVDSGLVERLRAVVARPLPAAPARPAVPPAADGAPAKAGEQGAASSRRGGAPAAFEAARLIAADVTEARARVAEALARASDDGLVRDLLYADLALLEHLRRAVEPLRGVPGSPAALVSMLGSCLATVASDERERELEVCATHWQRLAEPATQPDRDRALHLRSVVERVSRWVAGASARLLSKLATVADALGAELKVADWSRETFAEEVVRGGPMFVLGSLLRQTDAALREVAGVGAWQIVSPGSARGELRVVARLLDVQAERFAGDTVLLAEVVGGEEEIPEGVGAVITPADVDLLSHLAVRARNGGILLATLWDRQRLEELQGLAGQRVHVESAPGGDVLVSSETGAGATAAARPERRPLALTDVSLQGGVITPDAFSPARVGAKSRVLAELRRALPDWMDVPASIALAFGSFEQALASAANAAVRAEIERLSAEAAADPQRILPALREAITRLEPPRGLLDEIASTAGRAGLRMQGDPTAAWAAIRRVWASKWTDRAFFARRARGVPDDRVHMAVLVQEVVEGDYAFVLHTTNPLDRNPGELYGEVVVGMGEALVGNYPGRALGFVYDKRGGAARLVSYPSKSSVLRGHGLIFRSDSNAEDLEGFAGAGLFDSVTAAPLMEQVADYAEERLLWDGGAQRELTKLLGRVGVETERARGGPQDVEGVVRAGRAVVVQSRPQVGL